MKRLLYVDDDPVAHDLMKGILKDWDVISAFSGIEALELLEKEYGLIVITDIHMPQMNGIQLIKEVRKSHPITQVIVLSATEEANHLLAAYEAGANDFILKPFNKDEIMLAINNTLSKIERWERAMGDICKKKPKIW